MINNKTLSNRPIRNWSRKVGRKTNEKQKDCFVFFLFMFNCDYILIEALRTDNRRKHHCALFIDFYFLFSLICHNVSFGCVKIPDFAAKWNIFSLRSQVNFSIIFRLITILSIIGMFCYWWDAGSDNSNVIRDWKK